MVAGFSKYQGDKRDNRTDNIDCLCQEILDKKEARSTREGGHRKIPAKLRGHLNRATLHLKF